MFYRFKLLGLENSWLFGGIRYQVLDRKLPDLGIGMSDEAHKLRVMALVIIHSRNLELSDLFKFCGHLKDRVLGLEGCFSG